MGESAKGKCTNKEDAVLNDSLLVILIADNNILGTTNLQ